jgi:glucose/arabinose dehydrogenase
MWAITQGTWYGWPDWSDGLPLTHETFDPLGDPAPKPLLVNPPGPPPPPVARFGCHSSADGFDFSRSEAFGHVGDAFVALFGDQTPATGKIVAPSGFKVVRVDVEHGLVHDFAVNRGRTNGPASWLDEQGLERPVAARFDRDGAALYVVDFGVLVQHGAKADARPGTGVLWRITRRAPTSARAGAPR